MTNTLSVVLVRGLQWVKLERNAVVLALDGSVLVIGFG